MKKYDTKINFNAKIVEEIAEQLSGKIKSVAYVMKLFSVSKETAYRRLRNEIPFTLEEVAIIADNLNISIDQLLDLRTDNNNSPFIRGFSIDQEPAEIYYNLLKSDIEIMEKMLTAKELKITATINRIPFRLLPYKSFFKFNYCHYMHSIGKFSLKNKFSSIVVPPNILELHEKSASCFSNLNNLTCIVDNMIYSGIIKEVQYYHRARFLSDEDLQTLQIELFKLLETYEHVLRSGKNSAGSDCVFYYSFFRIESNTVFLKYDKNSLLKILIYPESPIIIHNNQTIQDIHERWIDSKMRNSMMITKANDNQQIEILRKIYTQIEEIRNYKL